MELKMIREKWGKRIQKYKYVSIVLLIGILLMTIPGFSGRKSSSEEANPTVTCSNDTEALTQILSQIKGAGKVRLLLTLDAGEKTMYQMDANGQGNSDTVIITNEDRAQQGLIQQITAPVYRGAIIVCQGADDSVVRLAIIEAVANATGLRSDRICVLKMK